MSFYQETALALGAMFLFSILVAWWFLGDFLGHGPRPAESRDLWVVGHRECPACGLPCCPEGECCYGEECASFDGPSAARP